eukprot:scaffold283786_cov24-Tisochrysis_lutea.AAC.2
MGRGRRGNARRDSLSVRPFLFKSSRGQTYPPAASRGVAPSKPAPGATKVYTTPRPLTLSTESHLK